MIITMGITGIYFEHASYNNAYRNRAGLAGLHTGDKPWPRVTNSRMSNSIGPNRHRDTGLQNRIDSSHHGSVMANVYKQTVRAYNQQNVAIHCSNGRRGEWW